VKIREDKIVQTDVRLLIRGAARCDGLGPILPCTARDQEDFSPQAEDFS